MSSSEGAPPDSNHGDEPPAPREGLDDRGDRTVFDDDKASRPPTSGGDPRAPQESTRIGIENLGERTIADLRGVIDKLDEAWRRRESESRAPMSSLGPYTELIEIGRGGMGIVYRARDPKSGGLVALKVPAAHWIGEASLRPRFQREARALSTLDHPGIVPYFDSGEIDGHCYIAGEYCDGPDLAAWLKRRPTPVPPKAAAKLVAALAEAVAHAHERGVLHRDLKPSNVLLSGARDSTDPMELSPRLTDFGLAKMVDPFDDEGETVSHALTRSGLLLGSPPYMAPEQAAGTPSEIGAWTDVYGLGAILYEVLTGRPPFRGENPTETLRLAREVDPIPVRVLRAGVPRALETIALKCLEKDPARRYGSAASLAEDLHRFIEGRSILAKPTPARERLRRWTRRRPMLASLIAAGLVGLSLAIGGVVAWNVSLQRYNDVITRERERADQNVYDSNVQLASKALEAGQLGRAQLVLRDMIPKAGSVDRRDFTWGHLWGISRREAQLISSGAAEITGLSLSPNGLRVAATDAEGALSLIDLNKGKTVWTHQWEPTIQLSHPVFSSDGRALAVAVGIPTDDPTRFAWMVEIRSAESGEFASLGVPQQPRRVEHLGFLDRDGLLVVATSAQIPAGRGGLRIATWRVGREREISPRLQSVSREVNWLAVAPDGASYAAPGADGRPVLYDVRTNAPLLTLAEAPEDLDGRAYFSPDGDRVAMGRGNQLFVWETASGRLLHRVNNFVGPIRSASLQPGGDGILAHDASEAVRLFDPSRNLNEEIFAPAGQERGVETTHLSFTPDGTGFLVNRTVYMDADRIELRSAVDGGYRSETPGRQIGRLGYWLIQPSDAGPALIYSIRRHLWRWNWSRRSGPSWVYRIAAHKDEIWDVASSPNGSIWATSGNDTEEPQTIKLWDARTGKLIRGWRGHEATVTDLDFSPKGRWLASSSLAETNSIRVWECPSGRERASLEFPDHETARAVRFDPAGSRLVGAGSEGTLRVWDADDFTVLWEIRNANDRIFDAAFNPSGDRVASVGELGFVRVYDADTGALVFEFRAPGSVLAVQYDPNGKTLAAADREGSIFLLDAKTGRLLQTIRSDDRQLYGLAFSPDGKTLAVGGHGRIVRLYDSETGNELLSLEGHEAQVNALAFSPDGLTLASADHEGVVLVWRADRGPANRPD